MSDDLTLKLLRRDLLDAQVALGSALNRLKDLDLRTEIASIDSFLLEPEKPSTQEVVMVVEDARPMVPLQPPLVKSVKKESRTFAAEIDLD